MEKGKEEKKGHLIVGSAAYTILDEKGQLRISNETPDWLIQLKNRKLQQVPKQSPQPSPQTSSTDDLNKKQDLNQSTIPLQQETVTPTANQQQQPNQPQIQQSQGTATTPTKNPKTAESLPQTPQTPQTPQIPQLPLTPQQEQPRVSQVSSLKEKFESQSKSHRQTNSTLQSARNGMVFKGKIRTPLDSSILIQKKIRIYLSKEIVSIERQKRNKRNKIVQEIYTSEKSYYESLSLIDKHFVQQITFNSRVGQNKYLEEGEIPKAFGNINAIINLSKELLAEFDERLIKNWNPHQKIGDIFIKYAPFFMIYSVYCENFEATQKYLKSCQTRNPLFKEFMTQVNKVHNLDIVSLQIMPVQRIPRYKLLLEELIKSTLTDHPDFSDLQNAIIQISRIADIVNNSIHNNDSDQNKKLVLLSSKLKGLGEDLIQPHRTMILEDQVWIQKKTGSPFYFVLFSDILIIIEEIDLESNASLNVFAKIHFCDARIKDLQDTAYVANAFQLIGTKKSYVIICKEQNQKSKLFQVIQKSITEEKRRVHRRPSLVPLSEESNSNLKSQNNLEKYATSSLRDCLVRVDGSMITEETTKPFTLYFVTCVTENGYQFHLHKRYSDFDNLNNSLRKAYPNLETLPKMPRRYYFQQKNLSDQVRGERQVLLDQYLQDLTIHDQLQNCEIVFEFLGLKYVKSDNYLKVSTRSSDVFEPIVENGESEINNRISSNSGDREEDKQNARQQQTKSQIGDLSLIKRVFHVIFHGREPISFEVVGDIYVSDLISSLCSHLNISSEQEPFYCIRLIVGDSQKELEERDKICEMLDIYSSSSSVVELDRKIFSKDIPLTECDIDEEYKVASSKFCQGNYIVGAADIYTLISIKLILEEREICLKMLEETTETKKEFLKILSEYIPTFALTKQSCEEWAVGIIDILKKLFVKEKEQENKEINIFAHKKKFITVLRKYPFYSAKIIGRMDIINFSSAIKDIIEDSKLVTVIVGICWDGIRLFENNQSMQETLFISYSTLQTKCLIDKIILDWTEIKDQNNSISHSLTLKTLVGYRLVAGMEWITKRFQ